MLAIGATPDELVVATGGLLARLSAEGADVTMAIVAIPDRLGQRRAEAADAADVIDAEMCLLYPDEPRRVEELAQHELVQRFDQLIAAVRPDLVITPSPNDFRPEHGVVYRAAAAALRSWPCDLLAYRSGPGLAAGTPAHGTCIADITDHVAAKLIAIGCHTSQLAKLDLASSRDLARAVGRIGGYSYAEAYEVLRVRL